jgi:glycosyltransferase involved in cell wall biosynthesis
VSRATLSVVIPNRDHGAYLPAALDSVLRQGRPPDEVIVVDDASADGSVALVREIASREPRVRLVCNQVSLGPCVATNVGVRLARGRYVYGLAADDLALPGFFERALALLERHPGAGLFSGDFVVLKPSLEVVDQRLPFPREPAWHPPDAVAGFLRGGIVPCRSSLYERSAWIEGGGLRDELEDLSDWFLGLVTAFRRGVCYGPWPCNAKRENPRSYSGARRRDPAGLRERIRRALRLVKSPPLRELLPRFARSGAFLHFGEEAARALLESPDDWDAESLALLSEPLLALSRAERGEAARAPRGRPLGWPVSDPRYEAGYLRARMAGLVAAWRERGRRVLVYGAGEHTGALFRLTDLAEAPLVALADRDPALQGERQFGLEVVAPERIAELAPDVVLVSSAAAEAEILRELRPLEALGIELVGLYGEPSDAAAGERPGDASGYERLRRPAWLRPRVGALVERWRREGLRVLVYGAGAHTTDLFRWTDLAQAPLVALSDDLEPLHGERLFGLEVVAPERIAGLAPDVVLISAAGEQDEVYRRLRPLEERGIELVRLYPGAGSERAAAAPTVPAPAPSELAEPAPPC